jgi:hypothetical protein
MIEADPNAACTTNGPVARVHDDGVTALPGVFRADEIAWARAVVLEHLDFMPNTRPSPGSRHLAGFHRFPALEPLHGMMTRNRRVQGIIERLCGAHARTIGLSDITVNRSQQWHKDLLRGQFRSQLGEGSCRANWHGTVFKVIVYLQDSSSLMIIPGSHREDVDLESDDHAIPMNDSRVVQVPVKAGDAVVIDICTTHRGSKEEAFASLQTSGDPKILISTVFGRHGAPLTNRMELGNAHRLSDWTSKNLSPA